MNASQLYARLFLPHRHGYPVWIHEPDLQLSEEYRLVGQRIGDVGIITSDGGFDFLFNICHPRTHPINCRGGPDNFESIDSLEVREISPFHNVKTDITTDTVHKLDIETQVGLLPGTTSFPATDAHLGFEFRVSASQGAILILPEGGSRTNLINKNLFCQSAVKDGLTWLKCEEECYRMTPFTSSLDATRQRAGPSLLSLIYVGLVAST
ncbi:hypothetical protein C8J56DRAFT_935637 [Mycena floridula]|nr:hypothetical protein C8J56DRAFT_935637 [Mycena floridula]